MGVKEDEAQRQHLQPCCHGYSLNEGPSLGHLLFRRNNDCPQHMWPSSLSLARGLAGKQPMPMKYKGRNGESGQEVTWGPERGLLTQPEARGEGRTWEVFGGKDMGENMHKYKRWHFHFLLPRHNTKPQLSQGSYGAPTPR